MLCQGSLNYPFKNSINKNLGHFVIAYISVLANCMLGISKTRTPGSEGLRNLGQPTCSAQLCSWPAPQPTPASFGDSLFPFSYSHPLRIEHVIDPHTSMSLPYSRFSLPRKGPEMRMFLQGQPLQCYGS